MTPFGWLMADPGYTGGQSDATYLTDSGIYRQQQELAERDGGPDCLNYTDRGFRDTGEAWKEYHQQLITPCNLRNGKFSPLEVLMTTDRANNRARNERGVKLPKSPMSKVPIQTPSPLIDLLWKNNVFRCNFIFRHLTASEACAVSIAVRNRISEILKSIPIDASESLLSESESPVS